MILKLFQLCSQIWITNYIISILTISQAIAASLARKYSTIIILSIIFSFIGILSELYFSYTLNIPSGPSIIVLLTVLLALVKVWGFVKGKFVNWLFIINKNREDIFKTLYFFNYLIIKNADITIIYQIFSFCLIRCSFWKF